MKKEEFQKLFKDYKPKSSFKGDEWNEALKAWKIYYNQIISENGLPIEEWLKKDKGSYLPNFLETEEKNFGRARIGNYEQVMIYKYTGSDKKRKENGSYRDVYKDSNALNCCNLTDEIKSHYDTYIKGLLQKIVGAPSLEDVYKTEKDEKYDLFRCKQILRKISVLTSLLDVCSYKDAFMWIYNEKTLKAIADILEVDFDSDKTYLENNKVIYDKAKEYAGLKKENASEEEEGVSKEDYIKLNDFIWYLTDFSNVAELSDFNSINVIFNGAPGTGKTYGVAKGINKLQNIDSLKFRTSKYIQFHPAFTYQDFIEGIKPLGIESGNLNLQVVNGSFKQFCIRVKKENEEYYKNLSPKPNIEKPSDFEDWPHYYFVVDEINRGNLSNIFGETFTLLEKDYRDYDFTGNYTTVKNNLVSTALSSVISRVNGNDDLVYKKIGDEVYFGIPFNIHFIGMMNDVDKSIDSFDLALRRRFKWISKDCDYDVIMDTLTDAEYDYPADNVVEYVESCKALNKFISSSETGCLALGKSYEIGHAFFLKVKDIKEKTKKVTKDKKKEVFESYIAGTLKEYIRQVADEDKIDGEIDKAKKAFGLK